MKITPLDLRNQEFGRTLRGYDPEEVRVFLELVSDEFEFLIKENTSLTERVRDLDEKITDYRNLEKTLNATLISAQKNAESYYENAKKEANLVLENARLESRRIVEEAQNQKALLEEDIARLQRTKEFYIRKFKAFIKEQLDMLAGEEEEPETLKDGAGEVSNPVEEPTFPADDVFRPTFSVDDDSEKEMQHDEPVEYRGSEEEGQNP